MPEYQDPYTWGSGSDKRYCVYGPGQGFGYDAGTLYGNMRLSTAKDAQAAALIANEAYRQGRLDAQQEARKALGIHP